MTIVLMFGLGLTALVLLGLTIFEAVTTAKGTPSPKLNWVRPLVGPLALLVLVLMGLKTMNDRRKLACNRGQK